MVTPPNKRVPIFLWLLEDHKHKKRLSEKGAGNMQELVDIYILLAWLVWGNRLKRHQKCRNCTAQQGYTLRFSDQWYLGGARVILSVALVPKTKQSSSELQSALSLPCISVYTCIRIAIVCLYVKLIWHCVLNRNFNLHFLGGGENWEMERRGCIHTI